MSSAINPPTMKKANEVTRYIRPIVLWSVVFSSLVRMLPLRACLAEYGVVWIGVGASAVMSDPAGPRRRTSHFASRPAASDSPDDGASVCNP